MTICWEKPWPSLSKVDGVKDTCKVISDGNNYECLNFGILSCGCHLGRDKTVDKVVSRYY